MILAAGRMSVQTEMSPGETSFLPPPLLLTFLPGYQEASSLCHFFIPPQHSASPKAVNSGSSLDLMLPKPCPKLIFLQLNCFCLLCCWRNKEVTVMLSQAQVDVVWRCRAQGLSGAGLYFLLVPAADIQSGYLCFRGHISSPRTGPAAHRGCHRSGFSSENQYGSGRK